jgi:hypothetical protein
MRRSSLRSLAGASILGLVVLAASAAPARAQVPAPVQVVYVAPHYGAWTVDPMPPVYRVHWNARPAWYGSLPRGRAVVVAPAYVPYYGAPVAVYPARLRAPHGWLIR